MGHKSLWQVGLSYLDHCPNDGIQMIELLLPRIFAENEVKCQKILREAKLRGLQNVGEMGNRIYIPNYIISLPNIISLGIC